MGSVVGKDTEFQIQTLKILPYQTENATLKDMYAMSFDYSFTAVLFFLLVAFLFASLFRVLKDAGDD